MALKTILNGKTIEAHREELEQLRSVERGIDGLATKAETAAKQREINAKQCKELEGVKPQIVTAQQTEKLAIEAKGAAEKELDLRQDHLTKTKLIASLKDHRAGLKEGEECPLCGATEHPLITGESKPTAMGVLEEELAKAKATFQEKDDHCHENEKQLASLLSIEELLNGVVDASSKEVISAQSEIQKLADLHQLKDVDVEGLNRAKEAQAGKIQTLKQHLLKIDFAMAQGVACENEQSTANHQVELISVDVKSGNEALGKLQETQKATNEKIVKLQQKTDEDSTRLSALLKPYQVSLPEAGLEKDCQKVLTARSTDYQRQNAQLGETSTDLNNANTQLERCEAELTSLRDKSDPFIQEAERNANIIQETGIKESKQLLTGWQKIEDAERSLRELQSTVITTETIYNKCSQERSRAQTNLQALTAALTERVDHSQFATISELRMSQLDPNIVENTEELKKSLQSEEDQLKGALEQRRDEIKELRAFKAAEGEDALKLKSREEELREVVTKLSEEIGAMKNALDQDEARRKTFAAKLIEIEESEKRLKVWLQLRELIGSQDGKKFSKYAQGISLEVLVYHANEHMQRLTKRYSMRRCNTEELDLEIVDHDQAEAGRPMASLSGGESFITSLALALGLANMAGKKTQIDSLFINEGFGSLDADSLDLAISALERLRRDNKTIGVISHVDLLKERIAVQIAVHKQSGGVSTLSVIPPVAIALAT
ncbi:MAG: SbcC/MukB-like Walker B domain-containing protein [Abditibacteriaceae bacterium]